MSKNICQCCGQTIKAPKAHTPAPPANTATMTTAELYAYYKRTAPLADVQFWIDHARMSDALRKRFIALQLAAPATIKRELPALQNLWRIESNARELAARVLRQLQGGIMAVFPLFVFFVLWIVGVVPWYYALAGWLLWELLSAVLQLVLMLRDN